MKATFFFCITMLAVAARANEQHSLLGVLPIVSQVHALAIYRGTKHVDAVLDDSNHKVSQVEVIVNRPGKSVVLVLAAYDPVIWRVGRTADTHLAGILVSGYHGQALDKAGNYPPNAIATHETGGPFPWFHTRDKDGEAFIAMNAIITKLTGRKLRSFQSADKAERLFVGDKPPSGAKILFSQDQNSVNETPQTKLTGQLALDAMVAKGQLRLANKDDIQSWLETSYQRDELQDIRFGSWRAPPLEHTYVVLRECVLPEGLFGANSRNFIVPAGAPLPRGPRGHNKVFRMDGTVSAAGEF